MELLGEMEAEMKFYLETLVNQNPTMRTEEIDVSLQKYFRAAKNLNSELDSILSDQMKDQSLRINEEISLLQKELEQKDKIILEQLEILEKEKDKFAELQSKSSKIYCDVQQRQ